MLYLASDLCDDMHLYYGCAVDSCHLRQSYFKFCQLSYSTSCDVVENVTLSIYPKECLHRHSFSAAIVSSVLDLDCDNFFALGIRTS